MSLHLNEFNILKDTVDKIPIDNIPMVIKSLDLRLLKILFHFIAEQIVSIYIYILYEYLYIFYLYIYTLILSYY
jgi:hypothetical protein